MLLNKVFHDTVRIPFRISTFRRLFHRYLLHSHIPAVIQLPLELVNEAIIFLRFCRESSIHHFLFAHSSCFYFKLARTSLRQASWRLPLASLFPGIRGNGSRMLFQSACLFIEFNISPKICVCFHLPSCSKDIFYFFYMRRCSWLC